VDRIKEAVRQKALIRRGHSAQIGKYIYHQVEWQLNNIWDY